MEAKPGAREGQSGLCVSPWGLTKKWGEKKPEKAREGLLINTER